MFKRILPLLLCISFAMALNAQDRLLSPNEFLPHKVGEQFTEHAALVNYYRHVAAHSNRIILQEFGRTNEERPQILAIVSSPQNLERIEEIRLDNLRRAGLAEGEPGDAPPVGIVWLGFSVHGNEAAGSEASMEVIYELANPANGETGKWLENTVVLIEPSVNPDGYSRYTSWYRQASPALPDPNPVAREHNEPWPGGRVNHYLYDLNRDWAWCTQVESQNRIAVYNDWLPHVVADLHEQVYTEPYYFAPAAQPYHTYLTDWQSKFQDIIGRNHARYFDANGWLYFTKEVFDLFYPSYGDTYPSFNGAIGMTYEQGGHSRAGRAIQLPNGDTLTLADRVAHHKTTALSTVEVTSMNAADVVKNFEEHYNSSQNNPPGPYKSFIVKANNEPHKLKQFTELLDRHKIRYGTAGKKISGVAGYSYLTGTDTKTDVAEGDLVISAYQPKGIFAQVLLEPESPLVDSLTYDITAWSLLHAYGFDAIATKQRIDPQGSFAVEMPKMEQRRKQPYAYLVPWNSTNSAAFLAECLKQDIMVRYAEQAFELDNRKWPAGTLVITRADNRKHEDFHGAVAAAAQKLQQEVVPAYTGFVDAGKDFGSENVKLIGKPKVLVIAGEGTFNNEFGQLWFFFDKEIAYPATYVDIDDFRSVNLDDFNTLILPEGFYRLDNGVMDKVNNWVSAGGKLIAIGYANRLLADKEGFALKRFASDADKSAAEKAEEEEALQQRTARYMDRVRSSVSNNMPGAVVEVTMDNSHPLAFGFGDKYFSLKTNSLRYDLLKNAWNVGYLDEDYKSHGFIGYKLKKSLKNSAAFAVQQKGRGKVIYLIDNPLFRSFWEQGKLLFSNAVFLVE
ncbi:MAG: M14 family metallopeptidase [Saprospiraceae bacterium]